ncbi:MAG: L,D-transpeptidase, partial [Eikenella corrodens]
FGLIGAQHLRRDWTHGCIAVTDGEIDELYTHVKPQAEIEILP